MADTKRELVASPLAGLTEERAEMLQAVERVFAGESIRKVARECGINYTTLRYNVHADSRYVARPDREAAIAEAKSEAIAIRRSAARITLEGLDSGEIPVTQAPIVYGIAADKLVKLDQLEKPKPRNVYEDLLDKLGTDGGTISVSVNPNQPAIDVTPQEDE